MINLLLFLCRRNAIPTIIGEVWREVRVTWGIRLYNNFVGFEI